MNGSSDFEIKWSHECMDWLLEHNIPHKLILRVEVQPFRGLLTEETVFEVEFEDEQDAILFKLRWGETEVDDQ